MPETEIRSVMAPTGGGELLLPNATVAEVVSYSAPDAIADAPAWLLGSMLWRGWQVPVVSFAVLSGMIEGEPLDGARICITKSLIDSPRMPYLAILTQGYPRLITITEAALTEVPEDELPLAVAGRAIIGDQEAWIPDLDHTARLVAEAVYGASARND